MTTTTRCLRAGLSLAGINLLLACSVPTEMPKYDTEWDVPAKSTTISVNTFLPSGVSAAPDNSAFQVSVSPATNTIVRQLGQDCASCFAGNGRTMAKPAFLGGGTAAVSLPASVSSAALVRDTLVVTIANGFNFDPIRPSGSARGYLLIAVTSGSAIIGRDSVDGRDIALSPGSNTTRRISLSGTISGASGLQIATTLNSPAGDAVLINTAQTLSISGSISQLYVSSARVSLVAQPITSTPTDLDLTSVDNLGSHVSSGSLELTVANPSSASGNLSVSFAGGTTPFAKPVALSSGTSTTSVAFTQNELRSLFGHEISIGFSGTVSGSIIVVPGQVVTVSSRLHVALNTGTN